jgi:hypothetical protein
MELVSPDYTPMRRQLLSIHCPDHGIVLDTRASDGEVPEACPGCGNMLHLDAVFKVCAVCGTQVEGDVVYCTEHARIRRECRSIGVNGYGGTRCFGDDNDWQPRGHHVSYDTESGHTIHTQWLIDAEMEEDTDNFARVRNIVQAGLAEGAFVLDDEEWIRTEAEVLQAIDEFVSKVWYVRTLIGLDVADGRRPSLSKNVPASLSEATANIEERFAADRVGPWTGNNAEWCDWEWGFVNGKLSALRWVLGLDWDVLDS